MGGHQDKLAQPEIITNKEYYQAGEIVQGEVRLNCLADRPYHLLKLGFKGLQSVAWQQYENGNTYNFQNQRTSYNDGFILANVAGGLRQGQYIFPFQFALPLNLPASFSMDTQNYIIYNVQFAMLFSSDPTSTEGILIQKKLQIRQPYRGIAQNLHIEGRPQSVCNCSECFCSCCDPTSGIRVDLRINVGFLQQGRTFHIGGAINNTKGKYTIRSIRFELIQQIQRVGIYRNDQLFAPYPPEAVLRKVDQDEQYFVHYEQRTIPAGGEEQFQTEITVPQNIPGYTAVGNIIGRSYNLRMLLDIPCILETSIQIPVVLTPPPLVPGLTQNNVPENWHPRVAERVRGQLRPYEYRPSQLITNRNNFDRPVIFQQEMAVEMSFQSINAIVQK